MNREAYKTTTALLKVLYESAMILYGLIRHKILYNNLLLSETYSFKFSTGGEARTPDTRFWRPVLYQLSYSRKNQFPTFYHRELNLFIISMY